MLRRFDFGGQFVAEEGGECVGQVNAGRSLRANPKSLEENLIEPASVMGIGGGIDCRSLFENLVRRVEPALDSIQVGLGSIYCAFSRFDLALDLALHFLQHVERNRAGIGQVAINELLSFSAKPGKLLVGAHGFFDLVTGHDLPSFENGGLQLGRALCAQSDFPFVVVGNEPLYEISGQIRHVAGLFAVPSNADEVLVDFAVLPFAARVHHRLLAEVAMHEAAQVVAVFVRPITG